MNVKGTERRFWYRYIQWPHAGYRVTLSGNRVAIFAEEADANDYCNYRNKRLGDTGTTAVDPLPPGKGTPL